jgi:hypothetical protein
MLYHITNEAMARKTVLELLHLCFSAPEPIALPELVPPNNLAPAHGTMTLWERQLAALVIALNQRVNQLYAHTETAEVVPESILYELEEHCIATHKLLYEVIENRIAYNRSLYIHVYPASDGKIYPCAGTCLRCQNQSTIDEDQATASAATKSGPIH